MNYLLSYEVDGNWERKLFDSDIELTLFIDKLDLDTDYTIDDLSGVGDKGTALEFILNEADDDTVITSAMINTLADSKIKTVELNANLIRVLNLDTSSIVSNEASFIRGNVQREEKHAVPREKKTQRGNILFTPSVYEDMQILAELEDTSFNNLLHELAKDYASKRADEIERYKKKHRLVEDILTML